MSERITILVGTMTGTSELVADEIAEVLRSREVDASVLPMDGLKADVFEPAAAYVIVTSTYGQGDVPDNARGLLASLEETKPDLSGVRYGVFALGDSTYADTFCFGGKKLDEALQACGAQRIGEREEHDAASGTLPEDEAAAWVALWHDAFSAAAADA